MTKENENAEHFTAWLTTDRSCLGASGKVDVTVLRDEFAGYETDSTGRETDTVLWTSTGDALFNAETSVDAKDGDAADAEREAVDLLRKAGWEIDGKWEAVDTGCTVTVRPV